MKSRLFKLALFLLLGAIVNVAVAWGFAYWVKYDFSQNMPRGQYDQYTSRKISSIGEEDKTNDYSGYTASRFQLFGSQRVSVSRSISLNGTPGRTTISFEEIIPRWGMGFLDIPELNNSETRTDSNEDSLNREMYTHNSIVDSRGWPSLSLWGGIKIPNRIVKNSKSDKKPIQLTKKRFWIYTIETPSPPFRGYIDYRWLPLRPIWPGFAINTIFYAAFLWLLTLGPFTARRMIRIKRGLCIKCGYDLRHVEHEKCPECGT